MFVQLNTLIVDADPTNREELAHFLGQFGLNVIGQLANCETLATLLSHGDAPQLVIINLDPNTSDNLHKVGTLPRQFPNISFFLMSSVLDPGLLMEAMHLGIREFIPLPIPEEKFAAAIERVANMLGMGKRSKLIHVVPTVGGCGSTTIACNVAAALCGSGKSSLLDLDLIGGGVASYFNLQPRYTIADVMESSDKVDKQLLDNALTVHAHSKLSVLARPELPEDTQRVTAGGMTRLMHVLNRLFDFVVVDSVMSIDPLYQTLIRQADVNLIVMQLNVPSAKNAERFVAALRRMGIEASKIRIVVNRYVKKGWDIAPEEIERVLGLKINYLIPNDFKSAIAAINYGDPMVLSNPRAEISASLLELASSLNPRAVAA